MIPTVKQSGIRVNAISLGTEAIEGVEMISLETGGTNSFATSAQEHFLLLFSHWLTLIVKSWKTHPEIFIFWIMSQTLLYVKNWKARPLKNHDWKNYPIDNFRILRHDTGRITRKLIQNNAFIKKSDFTKKTG